MPISTVSNIPICNINNTNINHYTSTNITITVYYETKTIRKQANALVIVYLLVVECAQIVKSVRLFVETRLRVVQYWSG